MTPTAGPTTMWENSATFRPASGSSDPDVICGLSLVRRHGAGSLGDVVKPHLGYNLYQMAKGRPVAQYSPKIDVLVSEVGPRDGLQSIDRIMPLEAKKAW